MQSRALTYHNQPDSPGRLSRCASYYPCFASCFPCTISKAAAYHGCKILAAFIASEDFIDMSLSRSSTLCAANAYKRRAAAVSYPVAGFIGTPSLIDDLTKNFTTKIKDAEFTMAPPVSQAGLSAKRKSNWKARASNF